MIKEAISKIVSGGDLTLAEARDVMSEIMHGQATPAQIGAFLTALRMKGETADEIAGCAQAMKRSAVQVRPLLPGCPTCAVLITSRQRFALPLTAEVTLAHGFDEKGDVNGAGGIIDLYEPPSAPRAAGAAARKPGHPRLDRNTSGKVIVSALSRRGTLTNRERRFGEIGY